MRRAPSARSCRMFCMGLTCALLSATCGPHQAVAQRQTRPIATLLAAGPSVKVNGEPAANGMPINGGDTVVTGPDSSAKLLFASGGSVQLDANTDPTFLEFLEEGYGCVISVVLNTGQLYAEGSSACISHGPTWLLPASEFNFLVGPGEEILTVTEGKVAVGGAQGTAVAAGTQVSLTSGRIVAQRPVSAEEMRRITGWRGRYRFTCIILNLT
jgi:hypothetical protein